MGASAMHTISQRFNNYHVIGCGALCMVVLMVVSRRAKRKPTPCADAATPMEKPLEEPAMQSDMVQELGTDTASSPSAREALRVIEAPTPNHLGLSVQRRSRADSPSPAL